MEDRYDKLVKGGLVVGPQNIRKTDIAIKDGKIAKMAP